MVRNGIPRVLRSAEQPEFRRNKPIIPSIPSSAESFFCRKLPTLIRTLSYAEAAAKPPAAKSPAAKLPAALLQASHGYVRRGRAIPPLSPLYVGPYEVFERTDKFFRLAVGGRKETVSIDCLKPHLGADPFSAAFPAARG
jgi:hypothetical protein